MTKAKSPSHFWTIWQETKLTDLDFVDDLALLTNECEQMQLMTYSLKSLGIALLLKWENLSRCSTKVIHVCKKIPFALDYG